LAGLAVLDELRRQLGLPGTRRHRRTLSYVEAARRAGCHRVGSLTVFALSSRAERDAHRRQHLACNSGIIRFWYRAALERALGADAALRRVQPSRFRRQA